MKLLWLGIAVLLGHLALLWWLQPDPLSPALALAPLRVLIRQPQPPQPAAPMPSARRHPIRQHLKAVPNPAPPTVNPAAQQPSANQRKQAAELTRPSTGTVQTPIAAPDMAGLNPMAAASATATAPIPIMRGNPEPATTPPSVSADYLDNPAPAYPALSLRRGEQGTVQIRVLIASTGQALRGELAKSSGFDRLDQAALRTVLQWRYVAARVDGTAVDGWFTVPVRFRLEEN